MDGKSLNRKNKVNFVYDFKGPGGYIPFGYNKFTFSNLLLTKFDNLEDEPFTGYYPSLNLPYNLKFAYAAFSSYIIEHTPRTKAVLTCEIADEIKKDEVYLIVLEALNVNNLFEYYGDNIVDFKDYFSPKLFELFKNNHNFKLAFIDSREGAYPHTNELLNKIYKFLDDNNITHSNKIFISTNNNFITNLEVNSKYKNFIKVFPNNNCLLIAGKFISEWKIYKDTNWDTNYELGYSLQDEIHFNDRQKYYLMYNRNSERMHRPYFVNELYKNNLLDKGFVSFFESEDLDKFLNNSEEYPQLKLNKEDIFDIRDNYKNYTPLVIDSSNHNEIAEYHNFVSRKDEYENSYFTIVSETNAESDYCFITEKTVKPIMNLHPFVINGNPHTLKVLKSYGFKTFDKWWDESYDDVFEYKERIKLVLEIVKGLCSKSKTEWNLLIKDMEETLIYNKRLLNKLWSSKTYQEEFLQQITKKDELL